MTPPDPRFAEVKALAEACKQDQLFSWMSLSPDSQAEKSSQGFLSKERYDNQDIQDASALRAANAVVSASASLGAFDGIDVIVRTGFNIGIANLSQSQEHCFSREGMPVRSSNR